MKKSVDLVGRTFGKLKVIGLGEAYISPKGLKYKRWDCICQCGNKALVRTNKLNAGITTSCGCAQKEKASKANYKHGESSSKGKASKEYQTWLAMKQRAYYKGGLGLYKEKGIKVCQRWVDSFDDFLTDVGRCPNSANSLDRIDNSGNYEPGNVRWTTSQVQAVNRDIPSNNTSSVKGVSWDKKYNKWIAYITKDSKRKYLGSYHNFNNAVKARKEAE